MFNSLNKKYLLPRLLGKSTAQIKILKNKSSYYDHFASYAPATIRQQADPLSSTPLTAKPSLTTQPPVKTKSPTSIRGVNALNKKRVRAV